MRIAVASGKGGTGKTTVAVNLAYFLSTTGQSVQYLDCDVEEPNGHLFLKPRIASQTTATVVVPRIIEERCTFCGECATKCQYNALVSLPKIPPLVFPGLCHGCGLCIHICPENAIQEDFREIGKIEQGIALADIAFAHGILNIGEAMAAPLIKQVKACGGKGNVLIIDAPPGTACPLVASIGDADIVVTVTEPTPFGLHDLSIAISVARKLGIPVGLVINRERNPFPPMEKYVQDHGITVFARIPEDRRIAESYSRGQIILEALPGHRKLFEDLTRAIGVEFGKSVVGA